MREKDKRHRNVAHLWADKRIMRFFRQRFPKVDYKNLRTVYLALCEIDSDFGEGVQIRGFQHTVATYAGLNVETATRYLNALRHAGLIDYRQQRDSDGRFVHSTLVLYVWDENEADEVFAKLREYLGGRRAAGGNGDGDCIEAGDGGDLDEDEDGTVSPQYEPNVTTRNSGCGKSPLTEKSVDGKVRHIRIPYGEVDLRIPSGSRSKNRLEGEASSAATPTTLMTLHYGFRRRTAPPQKDTDPIPPHTTNGTPTLIDGAKLITPSMFEAFWSMYPRKVAKGKAKKVWERLCRKSDRPTWQVIRDAVEAQKKTAQWQDKKFIPHPTTWLNQERWLDDPAEMDWPADLSRDGTPRVPGGGPDRVRAARSIIEEAFPNVLGKAFFRDCFVPAAVLLGIDEGTKQNALPRQVLAEKLVEFYQQIDKAREQYFTPDLWRLLPGNMEVICDYIEWLRDNRDWIRNLNADVFDLGHGLFQRFKRHEAKRDNLERDPITGVSYL